MANAHDELTLFAHRVDKLHGNHASIVAFAELLGSTVQSTTETITLKNNQKCNNNISDNCGHVSYNGEQTRDEGGNKILASSGADYRVVCP